MLSDKKSALAKSKFNTTDIAKKTSKETTKETTVNSFAYSKKKSTSVICEKLYFDVSDESDEDESDFDEEDFDDEDETDDDDDDEDEDYSNLKSYFNDERVSKKSGNVNYEYFNYDFESSEKSSLDPKSIYVDASQFYGSNYSYRGGVQTNSTTPSPACFQPGFFPRGAPSRSRMTPQPQETGSSGPQTHHHQQQQQPQHSYFSRNHSGFYASWYGSAPSLRIPSSRHHRQSLFLS